MERGVVPGDLYPGARLVAGVFLVTAAVILALSALFVVGYIFSNGNLHNGTSSVNVKAVVVGGVLLGSILVAAWVAFFGYVLFLLMAVHRGVKQVSDDVSELELSVLAEGDDQ